jgi:hypothetical protein
MFKSWAVQESLAFEDEDTTLLENVGNHLPDNTALHRRRLKSSE